MAFCANCGTKLEEGVKFCSACGFQVGSVGVSINQEKAVNIIQTQPTVLPMSNIPQNQNTKMIQTLGVDEKYCFSCGSAIKKAAELCTKCGVYQSMRNNTAAIDVYCASCGAPIKKEAVICPFCGVQQFSMAGISINQEKAINIFQTQPTALPVSDIPQNQDVTVVQMAGTDERYCFSCGSVIKKAAEICPKCGVNQSMRSNTPAIDVYCTSCGKSIKKEASTCPFCGVQQIKMVCPKCGTDQLATGKKGFSVKKAVVGTVLLGPVGLAAGLIGSKKAQITCQKCGHKWEVGKR